MVGRARTCAPTAEQEQLPESHARASNMGPDLRGSPEGHQRANLPGKSLLAMKHFWSFYVFIGEGEAKLNVAEKAHDNHRSKTPASRGRSAKPFAGTDR